MQHRYRTKDKYSSNTPYFLENKENQFIEQLTWVSGSAMEEARWLLFKKFMAALGAVQKSDT